jgi:hypothetical protein
MIKNSTAIAEVCAALKGGDRDQAISILKRDYPFAPGSITKRRYGPLMRSQPDSERDRLSDESKRWEGAYRLLRNSQTARRSFSPALPKTKSRSSEPAGKTDTVRLHLNHFVHEARSARNWGPLPPDLIEPLRS